MSDDYPAMAKYALDVRDFERPRRVDLILPPSVDPEKLGRALTDEAIERAIRRTEPKT